jgi:large subunit ribosomal protein L2
MKSYRPVTKSRRHMTTLPYKELLSGDRPHKALLKGKKVQAGRNGFGRITTRHQGGGHKQRLRAIDFQYNKKNIPAKIETVEYDPYRSAFIARVLYADGARRYHLVPKGVTVGSSFVVSEKAPIAPGNRLPLGALPVGTFVYNIELRPEAGAVLVRSAGAAAEVVAHDAGYAQVKLPSTEVRKISDLCWRPWAPSGTRSTTSSITAKPAARAGRASVRPCAAPR